MRDPETKLVWEITKMRDKQARDVRAAENDRYAANLIAAEPAPAAPVYFDPRLFRPPAPAPPPAPYIAPHLLAPVHRVNEHSFGDAPSGKSGPPPYISSHLLVPSGIRPPPPVPPPPPSFEGYDDYFGDEPDDNPAPILIQPPRDEGPLIVNASVGPASLGPNEFAQARFDRADEEGDDEDEEFYDAREGPAEIEVDPNAGNYPLIIVPPLEDAAEEGLYPVIIPDRAEDLAPYDARMQRDGALGDVGNVYQGEHKYRGPVSNPDSIAREEAQIAHAHALYPYAGVVDDEDEDEPGAPEPGEYQPEPIFEFDPNYGQEMYGRNGYWDQKQREWEEKGLLGPAIDEGPDALDLLAARGELAPAPAPAPVVVPIDFGEDESKDIPVIVPQSNVSVDVSGFDEPREVHVLPPGMKEWLAAQGLDESKMIGSTWDHALDMFLTEQELQRDQAEAQALLDEAEDDIKLLPAPPKPKPPKPVVVEEEFEDEPPDLADIPIVRPAPASPPSRPPPSDVIVEERPEPVFVNPDELEREPQQPEVKAKAPGFFSKLRKQLLPLTEEEAAQSYLPRAFRKSTRAELEADDDRDLERRLADLSYPTEEIDALDLLTSVNSIRRDEHKQPVRRLTPDMIAYINSLRKKAGLPTYIVTGDLDVELSEPGVEPEAKSAAAAVDVDDDVLDQILGRDREDAGPDFDPSAEDRLQQHRRAPERKVHFKGKYGKGFVEGNDHWSSKSVQELLRPGRPKRKLEKGSGSSKHKSKYRMKKRRLS